MLAGDALSAMRALPYGSFEDILGDRRAIVLSPHQDDESLGCGGLIAEACARGLPPVVAFVTDGAKSHPNSPSFPPGVLRSVRESEAQHALRALGMSDLSDVSFIGLPDSAAPHEGARFEEAVNSIAELAQRARCGTVLAPWRCDPHGDHVATYLMASEVGRRMNIRVLSYPIWGWLLPSSAEIAQEAVRGRRFDVRRRAQAKKDAIAAHASQAGKLILDDAGGFSLPPELLEACGQDYEVFLEP